MKIIFVHFNQIFPRHLHQSVMFARDRLPNSEIIILTNYLKNLDYNYKNVKVILISDEKYKPLFYRINNRYPSQTFYRDNYWFSSLLRFLVLLEWVLENNIEEFVHLESDSLLLLPEDIIAAFLSSLDGIYVTLDSQNIPIPSIFISTDLKYIINLYSFLILILENEDSWPDFFLNDMFILSESFKEGLIKKLPSSIVDSTNFYSFNNIFFIFDPAFIGQFLFGKDPRHNRFIIKSGMINNNAEKNILESKKWAILYTVDLGQTLSLEVNSQIFVVANVHNYAKLSKIPTDLSSTFWTRTLEEANAQKYRKAKFALRLFFNTISSSLKSRLKKWWAGRGSNPEPTD